MKTTVKPIDVERCVRQVENKFDLILIAAVRTRELNHGRAPLVDRRHKSTVTALAEIEQGLVGRDLLRQVGRRRGK